MPCTPPGPYCLPEHATLKQIKNLTSLYQTATIHDLCSPRLRPRSCTLHTLACLSRYLYTPAQTLHSTHSPATFPHSSSTSHPLTHPHTLPHTSSSSCTCPGAARLSLQALAMPRTCALPTTATTALGPAKGA
jgi:hypothetical protein